jgi:hypothetical protein
VTIQFEAILKEELSGLVYVGDILVSESSLAEAGTIACRKACVAEIVCQSRGRGEHFAMIMEPTPLPSMPDKMPRL